MVDLQIGAALYARVVNAHRDSDPELACTDGRLNNNISLLSSVSYLVSLFVLIADKSLVDCRHYMHLFL